MLLNPEMCLLGVCLFLCLFVCLFVYFSSLRPLSLQQKEKFLGEDFGLSDWKRTRWTYQDDSRSPH